MPLDADQPPRRTRRSPGARVVLGAALLLLGVGCLGWVGVAVVGTDAVSRHRFEHGREALRSQWSEPSPSAAEPSTPPSPPAAVVPGNAIALLRVPRFGVAYEVPIVEGTSLDALADGVGHYGGTALPGRLGNFALAGHRVTHGHPFSRLLDLRRGDTVVVETRSAVFTYTLDTAPGELTVPETDTWVLADDPVAARGGRAEGADPTRARITLNTCQDLFRSPDRSVAFGTLTSTRTK